MTEPKREYAADRTTQVQVRVTPAERDAYDAAAEAAGVSRSEWLRALAAEALSAGESRSLLSDVQRVVGAMAPPGRLEIYPIATGDGCVWGWTARAEVGDAVDEITRALSGLRGDTISDLCERTRAWVTARSITHGPTDPAAPPTRT